MFGLRFLFRFIILLLFIHLFYIYIYTLFFYFIFFIFSFFKSTSCISSCLPGCTWVLCFGVLYLRMPWILWNCICSLYRVVGWRFCGASVSWGSFCDLGIMDWCQLPTLSPFFHALYISLFPQTYVLLSSNSSSPLFSGLCFCLLTDYSFRSFGFVCLILVWLGLWPWGPIFCI